MKNTIKAAAKMGLVLGLLGAANWFVATRVSNSEAQTIQFSKCVRVGDGGFCDYYPLSYCDIGSCESGALEP